MDLVVNVGDGDVLCIQQNPCCAGQHIYNSNIVQCSLKTTFSVQTAAGAIQEMFTLVNIQFIILATD